MLMQGGGALTQQYVLMEGGGEEQALTQQHVLMQGEEEEQASIQLLIPMEKTDMGQATIQQHVPEWGGCGLGNTTAHADAEWGYVSGANT
jgi:hypothetical protein